MAGDVRQNDPDDSSSSQTVTAPENANLLPGGTNNTAGGKMREASFLDALKTIQLSDFTHVHQKPCVREALMAGIGGGFAIGGLRAITGAPIRRACNWAVGSFVFGSFIMHEYCQRKRMLEKQGIKRAVEVIDRKREERRLGAPRPSNESEKSR